VRQLKETAFVFLGGVAWHVGWQLQQHIKAGDLVAEDLKDISVALCGRGSGLFTRLHGKDPHARTEISKLLRLMALAAGDTRPAVPQVKASPFPKIEVAAGMIIAGMATRGKQPTAASAGDDDGTEFEDFHGSNDNIASAQVAEDGVTFAVAAASIGVEALDIFLRGFGIATGCKIELDPRQRAKLLNTAAEMHAHDEKTGRPPQSEFADILKALVELMRSRPDLGLRPRTLWS
jgi:hypothetical protein